MSGMAKYSLTSAELTHLNAAAQPLEKLLRNWR
jgi:hypothetical protein